MHDKHINLGRFTPELLDSIIRGALQIRDTGKRIAFLSQQFLGTAYAASTLIGSPEIPEVFIMNLESVDCFTFIEYVEAMRLSNSYADLELNLKRVRYRSGNIDFTKRNHFFTDWIESRRETIDDATDATGGTQTITIEKLLNIKEDGTCFLPGIDPVLRELHYIPSEAINIAVLDKLRSGDYIGIYSFAQGLDVSHTGIFVRHKDKAVLRHASSQNNFRKVIDEDFRAYISSKPGIIVLRPKDVQADFVPHIK
jgi:hypothetical protein